MKKLFFVVFTLFATNVYAQSTSSTWIDVTAPPYSAKNDCSLDAGPAINSAIAGAPAGSGVIFFPTGCYLISTAIVDANSAAWLTYLGEGNTMLYAKNGILANYLMTFGSNTISVGYRKIKISSSIATTLSAASSSTACTTRSFTMSPSPSAPSPCWRTDPIQITTATGSLGVPFSLETMIGPEFI